MNCLKKYIDGGGSLLVMLGDGGENQFQTNINFLLEEYGIMINNGRIAQILNIHIDLPNLFV